MQDLETTSRLLVYLAIALYTLAFLLFAFDIAGRGAGERQAAPARKRERELTLAGGGSETVVETAPPVVADPRTPRRNWARAGLAITLLGWLAHLAGAITRGIAAERVPWANMYEFALTGVLLAVAVFLGLQFWRDLRYLGVYITALATLFLGGAAVNYYVPISPLPPALQSPWLVIHVFVATLACGFLAVSSGLSILQLLQARRLRAGKRTGGFFGALPGPDALETMAYRLAVVGFIFWTFTLVAGAIWAHAAWGRYWGWDTKEVWTFIIWIIYAGYLHARATRGWRGTASAVLNLIGFGAVLFNFTVVNVFFKGLHAYSGL